MSKLNSLLIGRFKSGKKEKMNELVERSNAGQLSSFAGVFQVTPLNAQEKEDLENLLKRYQTEDIDTSADFVELATITSEVKAINNQAVILHGERIKKVQQMLKKYRDGAFSAYLMTTYGNRQTPYNFLLYYELYSKASKKQQEIMSTMPRQALYSLSSRTISQEEKERFIEAYQGETKAELLRKLRKAFPLSPKDRRHGNKKAQIISSLNTVAEAFKDPHFSLSEKDKEEINSLITHIQSLL